MDFDVLPGPSLPERARTALARAATATVSDPRLLGAPAAGGQVPVRSTRDGNPLLLPANGTLLAVWLAGGPNTVRVSLPAGPPFSALRLTGTASPVAGAGESGVTACTVSIDSIEFTGASQARVPVEDYRAAAPDPLWRVAPGVLHHLEHGHMGDLVRCVRAHGMSRAEWVVPRGLDRYGLELQVLTADGIAAVRLSFPHGPVTSLDEVPVSLRAALTCRCRDEPGHGHDQEPGGRTGRR
ncbi:MAG TPA: DUF2470 domain-containing protein [Trebonia sp.]|jgi:hypothetical protein